MLVFNPPYSEWARKGKLSVPVLPLGGAENTQPGPKKGEGGELDRLGPGSIKGVSRAVGKGKVIPDKPEGRGSGLR